MEVLTSGYMYLSLAQLGWQTISQPRNLYMSLNDKSYDLKADYKSDVVKQGHIYIQYLSDYSKVQLMATVTYWRGCSTAGYW